MRPRARLCAILAMMWAAVTGCAAAPDPLVVLIVVDTVRADRLSLYGAERPTSPALAARAEHGAVFEHAFATSPWTVPSIASLLTGRIPSEHGAGYRSDKRHGFTVLRDDVPTLAEELSEQGFTTAAIVNNVFLGKGFGLHRGFARYDHAPASDLELRRADEVVELALGWLREHPDGPRFLLLHLMDPHIAYDPPKGARGRFTHGLASRRFRLPVRTPAAIRRLPAPPSAEDRRFLAAAYDEELLGVDRALEVLLRELDAGLLSDAVVLLTSDHGEELFEHGGFEHGHALYQELLHVPFVLWGPGVEAGRYPQPVSLVDVPATLLEAVGASLPEGAGRSLWGVVTRGDALPSRDLVAEGMLHGPERRAVIRWPHKLDLKVGPGRARLFDLEGDPHEVQNLARSQPELVAELRGVLEALDGREGSSERRVAPLDADTREKLKGLGYVED